MMKRKCRVSGEEFSIDDEELAFYQSLGAPAPTLSPQERLRRRMSFRNFRTLYRRPCSASGKQLISMYDENVPFPVWDSAIWWSDSWDPLTFGQEIDFNRPFFEQYHSLSRRVPRFPIMNLKCENAAYANFGVESQNCYLVFGCVRNEDCLYGHIVWDCKNCVECLYAFRSELCSHSVDIVDCYNVHYSQEAANCKESYFLFDCRNCRNCFGCKNLRNAEYWFFGEQCSKEEYEARLARVMPLTKEAVEAGREWMHHTAKHEAVYPQLQCLMAEEVTGDHIYESRNLKHCFDAKKCEDSRYCHTAFAVENSFDLTFTGSPARFCLDSLTLGNCERVMFSHLVFNSYDVACSEFCYSSHDLFGCTGLRNAEYCILNKQYSREDYFQLRERLIQRMQERGEWGEFFPSTHSPFAYNESIANEYLPLTEDEAAQRKLCWKDLQLEQCREEGAEPLPYRAIAEVRDEVLRRPFSCAAGGKAYKIIPQELEFYRKVGLPLPTVCPDQRHAERMAMRHRRELYNRSCCSCKAPIQTAYQEEKRVLCAECYEAAVALMSPA